MYASAKLDSSCAWTPDSNQGFKLIENMFPDDVPDLSDNNIPSLTFPHTNISNLGTSPRKILNPKFQGSISDNDLYTHQTALDHYVRDNLMGNTPQYHSNEHQQNVSYMMISPVDSVEPQSLQSSSCKSSLVHTGLSVPTNGTINDCPTYTRDNCSKTSTTSASFLMNKFTHRNHDSPDPKLRQFECSVISRSAKSESVPPFHCPPNTEKQQHLQRQQHPFHEDDISLLLNCQTPFTYLDATFPCPDHPELNDYCNFLCLDVRSARAHINDVFLYDHVPPPSPDYLIPSSVLASKATFPSPVGHFPELPEPAHVQCQQRASQQSQTLVLCPPQIQLNWKPSKCKTTAQLDPPNALVAKLPPPLALSYFGEGHSMPNCCEDSATLPCDFANYTHNEDTMHALLSRDDYIMGLHVCGSVCCDGRTITGCSVGVAQGYENKCCECKLYNISKIGTPAYSQFGSSAYAKSDLNEQQQPIAEKENGLFIDDFQNASSDDRVQHGASSEGNSRSPPSILYRKKSSVHDGTGTHKIQTERAAAAPVNCGGSNPATGINANSTRNFECRSCFKRFLRRQDLNRHEATHITGYKPYHCNSCGIGFTRQDALHRHSKSGRCVGSGNRT